MNARTYCVYIMTNNSGTLHIGVTNDLARRMEEHRSGKGSRFTARHKMTRLVYYEATDSLVAARERERQLKGWVRRRKIALIAELNPKWRDLADTLA